MIIFHEETKIGFVAMSEKSVLKQSKLQIIRLYDASWLSPNAFILIANARIPDTELLQELFISDD